MTGSPNKQSRNIRWRKSKFEQRENLESNALHVLKWIGKSVGLACNIETYPFKDNEASRVKTSEAKVNKAKIKEEKKKEEERNKKEE